MKTILVMCAVILLAGAVFLVWRANRPDHHGGVFKGLKEVQIGEVLKNPSTFTNGEIRVKGRITRQCPVSGCWFFLDDGSGKQIKVEMSEVTPELPQNIGKLAAVEGKVVKIGDEYQVAGEGVEFSRK